LGLLEEFLKRPHQEARSLTAQIGEFLVPVADFSHLPTRCRFIALMPQWDFLNFLAEHAARYPNFQIRMETEVTELVEAAGSVVGARAQTPAGGLNIRADLVVGADGRHSAMRRQARLEVQDIGAPMDVLWMRISRHPDDPEQTLGRIDPGKIFVMIQRGDYWQCAFVIPKGGFDAIRARGLEALRAEIARLAPYLKDRVHELADWNDIKLLSVAVDRLRQWYRPGLLCIGDAAHAMSPIGGVGINLAVLDAVAAANLLAAPLLKGPPTIADLRAVQQRREFPTRATQRIQVIMQNRVIGRVLASDQPFRSLPWPVLLLRRSRFLQRMTARLVGLGIRPEHVRTPARAAPADQTNP
jgi:2-polyprenyl-6-methoxyphenol hydroxylase-like FAD-dependent oxidoreductase